MTRIQMEVKNCEQCPNCFSEKFYTADPWDHEANYYCKLFPGWDRHPKTDHSIDELVAIRNKPGVIELFVDYGLKKPVPAWCPLRPDRDEAMAEEAKTNHGKFQGANI